MAFFTSNDRRMVATAPHLTDYVIPAVPVRELVLAAPNRLAYFLHWNRKVNPHFHCHVVVPQVIPKDGQLPRHRHHGMFLHILPSLDQVRKRMSRTLDATRRTSLSG